jgi:hypothetical protein
MRSRKEETLHPNRPMNRREFFARAGMTVAGMTLAGRGWAIDTQGRIIVGSGEHRYEWVPDWLTPPDNIKWGDTHGIAQDSHGRIYITHTVHPDSPSGDAVVVFDKNGKFLKSWGSRFRGGGHGIEVHKEGHQEFLYHCDIAHRIFAKTTLEGEFLWEKGAPEEANVYKDGAPFVPTNIAFAPNGDFYVADGYGSNWIHQYDSKANYIRTFGGPGKEPGKFITPHGIWLDTRRKEPLLVITDRTNNRMQYFTLDGKFVRVVTEGMRLPCYFDIRGDVLMVADLKSVVTLLDKEDRVITLLGDGDPSDLRGHPRSDFIPGKFIHPHGAKYLHNGDILVVEWVPIGRVTLLRKIS